jgi:hypothetical protein
MTGNIFDEKEIGNNLERSSHDLVLGCTDFTKSYKTPTNSRCQKGNINTVPH